MELQTKNTVHKISSGVEIVLEFGKPARLGFDCFGLVSRPGHPRTQMLETFLDRRVQQGRVFRVPATQRQPRGLDPVCGALCHFYEDNPITARLMARPGCRNVASSLPVSRARGPWPLARGWSTHSSRTVLLCFGEHPNTCGLEKGNNLNSGQAQEPVEKLADRVSGLQIVKERLHWDSNFGEYNCPTYTSFRQRPTVCSYREATFCDQFGQAPCLQRFAAHVRGHACCFIEAAAVQSRKRRGWLCR